MIAHHADDSNEKNIRICVDGAVQLVEDGNVDGGIDLLYEVVSMFPSDWYAVDTFSMLLYRHGRWDEAIKIYRVLLDTQPAGEIAIISYTNLLFIRTAIAKEIIDGKV